jgi:hypothetical protein
VFHFIKQMKVSTPQSKRIDISIRRRVCLAGELSTVLVLSKHMLLAVDSAAQGGRSIGVLRDTVSRALEEHRQSDQNCTDEVKS